MEGTGFTYAAIKKCLYELAKFIRDSLKPDRMNGFDLQSILEDDDDDDDEDDDLEDDEIDEYMQE